MANDLGNIECIFCGSVTEHESGVCSKRQSYHKKHVDTHEELDRSVNPYLFEEQTDPRRCVDIVTWVYDFKGDELEINLDTDAEGNNKGHWIRWRG
ncbi:MAG: hypothetical protein KAJ10_02440 [Thermodesulfovibrionia bacterium]|nr:hypothetical protein [Thermodesulfovibrionia bacterium]